MISVSDALQQLFALTRELEIETVPLSAANGRVLATDLSAKRDQPPFAASAMDGYAIAADEFQEGAQFLVVGESAAGARYEQPLKPGQAVRIFTGAPVPEGADWIVIQEDAIRQGKLMTIKRTSETKSYVRPAGIDFEKGSTVKAPMRLDAQHIALLAAMNHAEIPVRRKPVVAIISTGSELVMPGETPGPDQIIASNTFGLQALLSDAGAQVRVLPIAHDTLPALHTAFDLAQGADLILTIGGASVGDHDLVADVAASIGMDRAFYKVAMRPGKPLMAGRIGGSAMIGLPGNPVSAMVCGSVFVIPVLNAMLGLGQAPAARCQAVLTKPLSENAQREHYMRAIVSGTEIHALDRQDSSLLSVLSKSNALLVRPPEDSARAVGETVDYIPIS